MRSSNGPAKLDVMAALWRHRLYAVAFLAVDLILVLLALALAPRKYTSEARLFLRVGRESVALDPTATTGQTISINETRQGEVASALELLHSRGLFLRIVDAVGSARILQSSDEYAATTLTVAGEASKASVAYTLAMNEAAEEPLAVRWLQSLGLLDRLDPRERAVRELEESLEAWVPRGTHVIAIQYEADSPEKAQQIVTAAVDQFRELHAASHRTDGSFEFFLDQCNEQQSALDAAAERLCAAKNRLGLLSIDGQRALLEQQRTQVKSEHAAATGRYAAAQAKIQALSETLAELPEHEVTEQVVGIANEAADAMRVRLYELEIIEQQLAAKLTDEHPRLIAIRRQVAEARPIVASQETTRAQSTTARSALHQPLQLALLNETADAESLRGQIESLEGTWRKLDDELRALNDYQVEIERLEREFALLEGEFRASCERLEQARIDQALAQDRISNVNVVQSATLQYKPSSPRRGLSLLAGVATGLMGGAALALLSAYREQTGKVRYVRSHRPLLA